MCVRDFLCVQWSYPSLMSGQLLSSSTFPAPRPRSTPLYYQPFSASCAREPGSASRTVTRMPTPRLGSTDWYVHNVCCCNPKTPFSPLVQGPLCTYLTFMCVCAIARVFFVHSHISIRLCIFGVVWVFVRVFVRVRVRRRSLRGLWTPRRKNHQTAAGNLRRASPFGMLALPCPCPSRRSLQLLSPHLRRRCYSRRARSCV